MMRILTVLLFLLNLNNVFANADTCIKITEKSGLDMSNAVCVLSNDTVCKLNKVGWFCFDINYKINNKVRIKKTGYYDYVFNILWEDSAEYILKLIQKNEIPLPEFDEEENINQSTYILGNTKTPPTREHKRNGGIFGTPIQPGGELFLYFDAKIDTGLVFFKEFHYYLTRQQEQANHRYRINVYKLNTGNIKLDKDDNVISFEPDLKSILYSTEYINFDSLEAMKWFSVPINIFIPTPDFIVGIEVMENIDARLDKRPIDLWLGFNRNYSKNEYIQYIRASAGGLIHDNTRISLNWRFGNNYPKKAKLAVYCELKNYY